jgi:hypothetical protein
MGSAASMAAAASWRRDHVAWVEAFVLFNFAALAGDIYLAHSENAFRAPAEYIPLVLSIVAPVLLAAGLAVRSRWPAVWRDVGYLVGWVSIAVGLTGVVLHLESRFFYERTLRALTYAAPFAAPLAYTGLGFLLVVDRMVDAAAREWAEWVLLLTLGGFFGNFVFSLSDHAMNGFYNPAEWIPVFSSAFAVSFLLVPFLVSVTRRYLALCALVLGVQAVVGVLGFALHALADLRQPGSTVFERIISGAPPMAPLLFPNLVLLGAIGLWTLRGHLPESPKP